MQIEQRILNKEGKRIYDYSLFINKTAVQSDLPARQLSCMGEKEQYTDPIMKCRFSIDK